MHLSLVFVLVVLMGFSVTVTSGDAFDRVMTRLRMSSASMIKRLVQNQRIQPWMLVPFFNWRMNKINGILEATTRCLNTPFCHRLVQSVNLLNYDRKWFTRFMGYKNFIIVWKIVLRRRRCQSSLSLFTLPFIVVIDVSSCVSPNLCSTRSFLESLKHRSLWGKFKTALKNRVIIVYIMTDLLKCNEMRIHLCFLE